MGQRKLRRGKAMGGSVTQPERRRPDVTASSCRSTEPTRICLATQTALPSRHPFVDADSANAPARIGRRAPPATPRHTRPPLRLLPSGPDRIHGFALRGDRRGPPFSDRPAVPEQGEQNNRAVNIRQGRSRRCPKEPSIPAFALESVPHVRIPHQRNDRRGTPCQPGHC